MSDLINQKKHKVFQKRKIFRLKEVDSTNKYASQLPEDTPEGSVVIAAFQTNGRGQGSNKWDSATDENIMLSIILNPLFLKANQQFYISKMISLAVADFLSLYTDHVSIKWPNDIYIKKNKVAGILIEHAIEGNFIKKTIAGIGININQKQFPENIPNPTSLAKETGLDYELKEVTDILLSLIENRYSMLKEYEFETINENYIQNLYRFGIKSEFSASNIIFPGTITGVENTGELIIKDEQGKNRMFLNKEVEFLN